MCARTEVCMRLCGDLGLDLLWFDCTGGCVSMCDGCMKFNGVHMCVTAVVCVSEIGS